MKNGLVGVAALVVLVACEDSRVDEGTKVSEQEVAPAAEPLPATSFCWIETAGRELPLVGAVTASGILVRHPKGDLLIDGGASTRHDEEVGVYSGEDRFFYETIVSLMKPSRPLPLALAEAGARADGVRWFLPTHVHADHVGGLMDMPDVPVLLTAPEAGLVELGARETTFEVVPAHARRIAPLVQPFAFEKAPYEGFGESYDFFGDESVVVVPLPGHTPGSVGVFLRRADGSRALHVGDAVSTMEELEAGEGKSWPMDRTDSDREETLERVQELRALHERRPELRIVPAHDRKAWVTAFGEPGKCAP